MSLGRLILYASRFFLVNCQSWLLCILAPHPSEARRSRTRRMGWVKSSRALPFEEIDRILTRPLFNTLKVVTLRFLYLVEAGTPDEIGHKTRGLHQRGVLGLIMSFRPTI